MVWPSNINPGYSSNNPSDLMGNMFGLDAGNSMGMSWSGSGNDPWAMASNPFASMTGASQTMMPSNFGTMNTGLNNSLMDAATGGDIMGRFIQDANSVSAQNAQEALVRQQQMQQQAMMQMMAQMAMQQQMQQIQAQMQAQAQQQTQAKSMMDFMNMMTPMMMIMTMMAGIGNDQSSTPSLLTGFGTTPIANTLSLGGMLGIGNSPSLFNPLSLSPQMQMMFMMQQMMMAMSGQQNATTTEDDGTAIVATDNPDGDTPVDKPGDDTTVTTKPTDGTTTTKPTDQDTIASLIADLAANPL